MKTKAIILIVAVALITLSFSFTSVKEFQKKEAKQNTEQDAAATPIGGFASEDSF